MESSSWLWTPSYYCVLISVQMDINHTICSAAQNSICYDSVLYGQALEPVPPRLTAILEMQQ